MLNRRVLAAIVVSVIAFCCVAISVEDMSQLPNMLTPQLDALGTRMTSDGKENTVYEGVLTDAAGNTSQARVMVQSGMVKLEGFKGAGSVIAFDGNSYSAWAEKGRMETRPPSNPSVRVCEVTNPPWSNQPVILADVRLLRATPLAVKCYR